ncbi:twinfilin-1 [Trichoderma arundinaceum]|uniref:Twinfilin-1 n=1 Tax=Trichoderma arundinaceum TaxID=490622 RepID=A0A395NG55_TRIAR|nr:twinfilin-1 [Trichoderma arundinaceum]
MIGIFLLAFIGVTRVFSQSIHSTGAFSYQGCSSIDPSCFGDPIVFSDGRLTPESCQLACQGHQFVALLPDSCRCGDDANGIQPTDEAKCDYPCMGDGTLGMCGSICPENTPVIANIYTRVTPSQGPTYGDPTSIQSSVAAAAETSCSSTDASSVGNPPQSSQRLTPEGPAPEVPTSFGNPAATNVPTSGYPATQTPQESPCTTQSNAGVNTASHNPQGPQGPLSPPGNAPEPKTISVPNQQVPNTTPSSNAPNYSSDCQSPQPDSYSGGDVPGIPGGKPGGDSSVDNCNPAGGPSLSPVVSESTLWPWPSKKPEGDPPAPSQVPASDSTSGVIPPLSSIGGFALLAAMIM